MITYLQYYYFLLFSHTIIFISGFYNTYFYNIIYETDQSIFILYSMITSLIVYFVLDLYYMYKNYMNKYDEFIIHHSSFLLSMIFILFSNNYKFMRLLLSICAMTELSSIILDIEGLYKLKKNPHILPMFQTDDKNIFLIYLKILFLILFITVRYITNAYYIYICFITPWTLYEQIVLYMCILAYLLMHIFWLYKIVKYIRKHI